MPGLNRLYRLCRIGSDAADAVRPAGPFCSDMCGREGRRRARTFVFARGIVSVDSIRLAARSSVSLAGKMRGAFGAEHGCAIRLTALPALSVWVGMPVRAGGRKVPSHFGWALRGAEPVSRPAVPARFSPSPARRCFPKCFFRFGTDVRRSAVSSDGTFFRWDDVPEREPACRKGPQGNNLRMRACMRASPQRLSGVSP